MLFLDLKTRPFARCVGRTNLTRGLEIRMAVTCVTKEMTWNRVCPNRGLPKVSVRRCREAPRLMAVSHFEFGDEF